MPAPGRGASGRRSRGPTGSGWRSAPSAAKGGRPLRVALAQAGDMGGVAATNALLPLVEAYRPRCVAMCGVCAGRPGKTNLGDVIAAERLFFHDTGKRAARGRAAGSQDVQPSRRLEGGARALRLRRALSRTRRGGRSAPCPTSGRRTGCWPKLHQGVTDPSSLPECDVYCPQWEKVIEALWKSGHVQARHAHPHGSGAQAHQALS